MDVRSRLLIASICLATGRVEPWPDVLAALATGGASASLVNSEFARALVRLLVVRSVVPGEQLEKGQLVLGSDGKSRSLYQKGTLVSQTSNFENQAEVLST